MKTTKYPDGSSYATIDYDSIIETPMGDFAHFTHRINSYEDLWNLNQIVDAYKNLGAHSSVIIPCLFDAQADRRFSENQSFGLKLIIDFLARMDASFTIFHPHNPEVVEMGFELLDNPVMITTNYSFIDKVLVSLTTFVKNASVQSQLDYLPKSLILMSSDAGGFKPLMKLCDDLQWKGETYSASKSRKYVDGKSKLIQLIDREDFGGKDVLIIDDISVYGGTFKGLAKLLRERNVGKLYLAVSHMTVYNLGEDNVCKYFDKVFTTNSKFDHYDITEDGVTLDHPDNLEIIKMF